MRKYQCNACGICICSAEYQDGSGVPFKCTYVTDRYCKPQWEEIEREVANLPKLTAEVFDRPDCPEWAKYAAVDGCGRGFYYEAFPRPHKQGRFFLLSTVYGKSQRIPGKFDGANWINSIVIRQEKSSLPDWCKVGEWVYYPEEMGHGVYLKISEIKTGFVHAKEKDDYDPWRMSYKHICEHAKPARLRPYNAEEMKPLVGRVLNGSSQSNPFSFLVVYAEGDGSFVESHRFRYTAKELKGYFTIKGKPCGVLEHLEEGEWVK